MNLYKISQTTNHRNDIYDAAVVAAETEGEARHIHPDSKIELWEDPPGYWGAWVKPDDVIVELVGTAAPGISGVVLASFNAA